MLPMRDNRTNEQTVKIELLSQWMIEAEFRNNFKHCEFSRAASTITNPSLKRKQKLLII